MNDLSSKTGAQSIASNYEDYLKESINIKLSESGYELEDIEFSGSAIESIKIKEKNKNNSDNLDKEGIEFNKDGSKQVFKDKQSINTKDLKEDLNNVLDISIKKIEIN
jgi:stage III sporulation protein AF